MDVEGGQSTSQPAAQLGKSVEDNAGTGGGGGSLVYTTDHVIMVWTVRWDQVTPVVRGKIRHKFEMEVQMGS